MTDNPTAHEAALSVPPLPVPQGALTVAPLDPGAEPPLQLSVIVPTFNDPNDRVALGTLGDLFKDRPVAGIHAVDLVLGFGTLHCLTQQEPALNPGYP